jgi:hypothetical protein
VEPEARAGEAFEMVRAVREQVRQASAPGSTLLKGRSAATFLGEVDLSLPAMRAAAKSAGGTVNDVFLAGLLAGLGAYHDKHGDASKSVRMGMPISTRSGETTTEMRNQVEGVVLRGPLVSFAPDERIRLVRELVSHARSVPLMGLVDEATALAGRVPGAVSVLGRLARTMDVLASNVPGPPVDLFFGGARLERMVPYGPRGGAAVNFTLLSYADAVHIGVNADPVAIPDGDLFRDCIASGFEEVLASA